MIITANLSNSLPFCNRVCSKACPYRKKLIKPSNNQDSFNSDIFFLGEIYATP
jgi:hypothetical protein